MAPNIDAVHLFTFDQKTPERNPQEADYPAPIYESYGRVPQDNVDATTRWAIASSSIKSPKLLEIRLLTLSNSVPLRFVGIA